MFKKKHFCILVWSYNFWMIIHVSCAICWKQRYSCTCINLNCYYLKLPANTNQHKVYTGQGYSVSERANDWISLQFFYLWYKYVLLMFIARFIFCLICLWCNIQLHLVEFWEEMMIVVNLSRHVWDHWNCFVCVVFVNSFFINSAQCWCTCICINDVFNLFPF